MVSSSSIIVCGYPKSGNTWITRLIAEIIECPVSGFYGEPYNRDIAMEGRQRKSRYSCYKSHSPYRKLAPALKNKSAKLIYVIRDPRDVAISGSHFFTIKQPLPRSVKTLFSQLPKGRYLYSLLLDHILHQPVIEESEQKLDIMIDTVLDGNLNIRWCEIPWEEHVSDYLSRDILSVKYEDVLETPLSECQRILEYLDIKKTEAEILRAVQKQSFEKSRDKFRVQGNQEKYQFMRAGKKEQWKTCLTTAQKNSFNLNSDLNQLLNQLEYTPSIS